MTPWEAKLLNPSTSSGHYKVPKTWSCFFFLDLQTGFATFSPSEIMKFLHRNFLQDSL